MAKQAKKLPVFNLGALGVNVVDSPIHTVDGELLQGQNAVVVPQDADLAIGKRPGLYKLTSVAGSGAVLNACNIPYPNVDPSQPQPEPGDSIPGDMLILEDTSGIQALYSSLNGTDWIDAGASGPENIDSLATAFPRPVPSRVMASVVRSYAVTPQTFPASALSILYWPGTGAWVDEGDLTVTAPIAYGGENYYPVGVLALTSDADYLYALVGWATTGGGSALIYTVESYAWLGGSCARVGTVFNCHLGASPLYWANDLVALGGYVYVVGWQDLTPADNRTFVFRAAVGDAAWADIGDFSGLSPADKGGFALCVAGPADLYVASNLTGAGTAALSKLSGGVWSVVYTAPTNYQYVVPVWADASQVLIVLSPQTLKRSTNAGGSWTDIYTFSTTDWVRLGRAIKWGVDNKLYFFRTKTIGGSDEVIQVDGATAGPVWTAYTGVRFLTVVGDRV